ncbi:MAG: hypothetical protein ACRENS_08750 [Candidatus Eiseniibacteriota bacterium]
MSADFQHVMNDNRFQALSQSTDAMHALLMPSFGKLLDDAGFRNLIGNKYLVVGRLSKPGLTANAKTMADSKITNNQLSEAQVTELKNTLAHETAGAKYSAFVSDFSRLSPAQIDALRNIESQKMTTAVINEYRAELSRVDPSRISDLAHLTPAQVLALQTNDFHVTQAVLNEYRTAEGKRMSEAQILQMQVDLQKLSANQINDLRVGSAQQLSEAKTNEMKLALSQITDAQIVGFHESLLKLSDSQIQALHYADAAVIDANQIDASKISGAVVDANQINDSQIYSAVIDASMITDAHQLAQAQAELVRIQGSREFQDMLKAEGFKRLAESRETAALVNDARFLNFFKLPDMARVMASDGSRAALANVISDGAARGVITSASFTTMAREEGMSAMLADNSFATVAAKYSDGLKTAVDGYKIDGMKNGD